MMGLKYIRANVSADNGRYVLGEMNEDATQHLWDACQMDADKIIELLKLKQAATEGMLAAQRLALMRRDEIDQLTAQLAAMRAGLGKIAAWDFNIMGDCVAEAKLLATNRLNLTPSAPLEVVRGLMEIAADWVAIKNGAWGDRFEDEYETYINVIRKAEAMFGKEVK